MESFKSFGNFLQLLIGDWRHREKIQNFGCREKHSSILPKSQQSGHLNGPLFRQSALSPVCYIVWRLFWPIAHFRQLNCVKSFGQFGTLTTFGYTAQSDDFWPAEQFNSFRPVRHYLAKCPLSAKKTLFGQTPTFGQFVTLTTFG